MTAEAKIVTAQEDKDHIALVNRILESEHFADIDERTKLLRYLFDKRRTRVSAKVIESEHFGKDILSPQFNESHARNSCEAVRYALIAYKEQATDDDYWCELPLVKRGQGGYQLTFHKTHRQRTASELFWQPHLDVADDVIVVSGSHLFFYDSTTNSAFRYYDFNKDLSTKATLKSLRAAYPQAYKTGLEPLRRSYLSSGEVHAFDVIQRWFHGKSGKLIPRFTSREKKDTEIHDFAPILIGRPATNRFIESMMKSRQASSLAYRIHSTLGAIKIDRPSGAERQALSEFPMTQDGVLGPVRKFKTVFGLVSRFHNPSGHGSVTIITADFQVRAIAQIADVLTKDKLTAKLLTQTKWPLDKPLPDTFELLFAVEISPGDLEGEGQAKFLVCRP